MNVNLNLGQTQYAQRSGAQNSQTQSFGKLSARALKAAIEYAGEDSVELGRVKMLAEEAAQNKAIHVGFRDGLNRFRLFDSIGNMHPEHDMKASTNDNNFLLVLDEMVQKARNVLYSLSPSEKMHNDLASMTVGHLQDNLYY